MMCLGHLKLTPSIRWPTKEGTAPDPLRSFCRMVSTSGNSGMFADYTVRQMLDHGYKSPNSGDLYVILQAFELRGTNSLHFEQIFKALIWAILFSIFDDSLGQNRSNSR